MWRIKPTGHSFCKQYGNAIMNQIMYLVSALILWFSTFLFIAYYGNNSTWFLFYFILAALNTVLAILVKSKVNLIFCVLNLTCLIRPSIELFNVIFNFEYIGIVKYTLVILMLVSVCCLFVYSSIKLCYDRSNNWENHQGWTNVNSAATFTLLRLSFD